MPTNEEIASLIETVKILKTENDLLKLRLENAVKSIPTDKQSNLDIEQEIIKTSTLIFSEGLKKLIKSIIH